MKKSLIIVAPNGAKKMKSDHPALPMTPEEIAQEVAACAEAGAAMVHLHARDNDGHHSLDIDDNLQVMDAVKARVGSDVVIQVTTEAIGIYTPQQQMALIKAVVPEAASFAIKELIPDQSSEKAAADFFHWVAAEHILPQYILYSGDDVARYLSLKAKGVIPDAPHHLLFVLGRYHVQQQSSVSGLREFLQYQEQLGQTPWACCAFGISEQAILLEAAKQGGDVRIGFENNLFAADGKQLAINNASQVSDLVDVLKADGISPMNVSELRQVYGCS